MIYPKFLSEGSVIGVTAPSDGITDDFDLVRLSSASRNLSDRGFSVILTDNVRTSNNMRSSSALKRAKELESLFLDDRVDLIISACGGEFLMEMIPYLNYDVIAKNPKWFQGYSDPTWITYTITTNLDIATVYSNNYKAFGMEKWHKSLSDNIDILEGRNVVQNSFDMYEGSKRKLVTGLEGYNLDSDVNLKIVTGEESVFMSGRMIGGCLDVIGDIFGTKYDKTISFISKYKDDGIIWYFESFSLSSENIIRLLWKLKDSGYFEYTKGIVFGRNCMYSSLFETSFEDTVISVLGDLGVPIVIDADIGHVGPRITVINGAIADIGCSNGKGNIRFSFR